jgi:hypothetical protein
MPLRPLAAVLVLLSACGPSMPDQVTESRWFRYHHWADEVPCQEALDHLDSLVDFVVRTTGVSLRAGERFDYIKLRERDVESARQACVADACAIADDAYSTSWAHDHEVVHAIFGRVGSPPAMFEEAVAMILGCGPVPFRGNEIDLGLDLAGVLSSGAWDKHFDERGPYYDAAASFVRWLIDEHGGWPAVVGYYGRAPHEDAKRAREEFRAAFGLPFDFALQAWRTTSPRPSGSVCILREDRCGRPPDLRTGAATQMTSAQTCLGGSFLIEVPETGWVRFGARADGAAALLSLESCEGGGAFEPIVTYPIDPFLPPGTNQPGSVGRFADFYVHAPRGRYTLQYAPASFQLNLDFTTRSGPGAVAAGTVTLRGLEGGAPWSADCDASSLDGAGRWHLAVEGPASELGPDGRAIRVRLGTEGWLGAGWSSGDPDWRLDTCGLTCGATAPCADQPRDYLLRTDWTVWLPPPTATFGERLSLGLDVVESAP